MSALMPSDDKPANLIEKYTTQIEEIPSTGKVANTPWSGYYWALRYGGLSMRYCKGEKNTYGMAYKKSIEKYSQPAEHKAKYQKNGWKDYVNNFYSPAEKYDLLVGDYSYTYTNIQKKYAEKFVKDGDVESWMGYCHGWCPAAIYEKKPVKSVTLTAYDGKTKITFWPDDIKALITAWWAQAHYDTDFMGNSCTSTKVTKDTTTGLYLGKNCASNNAASWHIVFGNHVGIEKKGIVFDPNPDGEVWNQPAYSHEFKYFNVLTNKFYSNPLSAKVSFSDVKNSNNTFLKFVAKYADKNKTKYIVGVTAKVVYIAENHPSQGNAIREETKTTMTYKYELELDSKNKIIGGQWYTNTHPNFVWKVHTPEEAYCPFDKTAPNYTGTVQSIKNLAKYAKKQSEQNAPLRTIVKYLIKASSA